MLEEFGDTKTQAAFRTEKTAHCKTEGHSKHETRALLADYALACSSVLKMEGTCSSETMDHSV